MPNSEYLRLKALLDSNPQYRIMLDTISKAEGTWGKDAYSTTYGGKKIDWTKGKDKTVRNDSSAHGKYQFMNETWFGKEKNGKHIPGLQEQLELSGFSPEEQDVAALKLLEDNGSLKHIDDGKWDKAIFSAAPVWAALPKNEKGESALKFKNGKPQPAKPLSTVLNYTKSNDEAFAARNKALAQLNKDRYNNTPEETKKGIIKRYNNFIEKINNDDSLTPEAKNKERQAIKNKYYRAGNFGIINKEADNFHRRQLQFIDDVEEATAEQLKGKREGVTAFNPTKYIALQKKAKEYGFVLPKYDLSSESIPENFGETVVSQLKSIVKSKYEPNVEKYGYTREEYDAEVLKNTPKDTGIAADIENGTVPETAKEKADKLKVEADAKAKADAELAKKNRPFEGSDLLNKFKEPGEFVDPQFQYVPGKQQIPFDALIGLTTGMMGAAAADDVEIKYRDEKISEGMLLYAQDIAKIKNMGLPPEIEGGLKMKLQDAYQTGLENIVRASNGNRNLVLGNQGQLDQARMNGLVEIAAMDVERSDKAMAAFGEVQKYINEFDSKRDIANNERKYQEDQKTQMAGMQLAQQGMSNFIDAIQKAKENGPGSMNDMKRQYFQFATTGLLPNAKEGAVGSPEYKAAIKAKNDLIQGKKNTYRDWIATKNMDEKDIINNILTKHPEMNPFENDGASFDDFKKYYDKVSGTDEFKSEYQKSKGISDLTTKQVEDASKKITGVEPAKTKEVQTLASVDDEIKVVKKAPTAPTIVTTEKTNPDMLLNQLVRGANGQETGVNTLELPSNKKDPLLSLEVKESEKQKEINDYQSLTQK